MYKTKSFDWLQLLKWGFVAVIVILFVARILKGLGKLFNVTQWDIYKDTFGETDAVIDAQILDGINGQRDKNGSSFTKTRLVDDCHSLAKALRVTYWGIPNGPGIIEDDVRDILRHYNRRTFVSLNQEFDNQYWTPLLTVLNKHVHQSIYAHVL